MRSVTAQAVVLAEPINLWGGLDPASGLIVDPHHPQRDMLVTNRIMVVRGTSGSSSGSGVFVEAMRLGKAPAGVILPKPDLQIEMAALLAEELYDLWLPIAVVPDDIYARIRTNMRVEVRQDGTITLST